MKQLLAVAAIFVAAAPLSANAAPAPRCTDPRTCICVYVQGTDPFVCLL